jgi:hypothetical protein
MDITIEAPRTTVEAPVSVTTGPTINVGVEVPEHPELAFSVLVEPVTIGVNVVTGGGSGSSELVSDSSPQLGGDLDLNGNQITGTLSSPLLTIDCGLL